jgi:UDP-2,4-diacetamido-2,4,6-trideoxy-beta-L-altropyranose hydrolase
MNVVVRADASSVMGAGHVQRCLALADGLRTRGAKVTFVTRAHPGHLAETIVERGHEVRLLPPGDTPRPGRPQGWLGRPDLDDAAETCTVLRHLRPDWLVVDHYGSTTAWQRHTRAAAKRLLVIDDLTAQVHEADVILNQNRVDAEAVYRANGFIAPTCVVLAGPAYSLLRPEFLDARVQWPRVVGRVGQALIALGGTDPDARVTGVLDALRGSLDVRIRVHVVFGVPDSGYDAVVRGVQSGRWPWRVAVGVGLRDMGRVMAQADLAVGAAGSSSWERCCVGLPSVAIVLAENQRGPAVTLREVGAARVIEVADIDSQLGPTVATLVEDVEARHEMMMRSYHLVDGRGVERVVMAMAA